MAGDSLMQHTLDSERLNTGDQQYYSMATEPKTHMRERDFFMRVQDRIVEKKFGKATLNYHSSPMSHRMFHSSFNG